MNEKTYNEVRNRKERKEEFLKFIEHSKSLGGDSSEVREYHFRVMSVDEFMYRFERLGLPRMFLDVEIEGSSITFKIPECYFQKVFRAIHIHYEVLFHENLKDRVRDRMMENVKRFRENNPNKSSYFVP